MRRICIIALCCAGCAAASALADHGDSAAPGDVAAPGDPAALALPAGGATGGASPRSYDALIRTLNAVPTPPSLEAFHNLLGSEPHIAGTAGDERTVERLRAAFVQMGLPTVVEDFWALLAYPRQVRLEIVEPSGAIPLPIIERPLPEDPHTAHPGLAHGWNAYSGDGDVTAEVVYANYGTRADFEALREKGVDATGKLVLVRYGGNFRGYKWKYAQQAGAAGVLIYTDPADAGSARGPVYPEGGWANDTYVQRGSILTLDYPGDPLTPFEPATADAPRVEEAQLDLPRIPVQPIGYAAAEQIMRRMTGKPVEPESRWRGGLPLEYHLEGGPDLRVRLQVEQERQIRRSSNVIAMVEGRCNPDQFVVIGCHHDAWSFGAGDPLAGTIVLLECARSFAAAAARGQYPDRTVIFAAWGAEEYGIIGSTEWVEGHRQRLARGAVAYVNLDMAAMGPNFGAACSPSLREAILSATVRVPQAHGKLGETVYDRISGGGRVDPRFGDLGGGSDHVGFNCHLGVACMSLGGGGSQGVSYHSNYDTLTWYRAVVGGDYEPALMITRMCNAVAALLADTPVVPLSAARHGRESARVIQALRARPCEPEVAARLDALISRALATAERGAQLDAALASAMPTMNESRCRAATQALLAMDRAWVDDAGLEGRPWFRSLLAASDRDSGYASVMLPLLTEAFGAGDPARVQGAVERYMKVFDRLDQAMQNAARTVQESSPVVPDVPPAFAPAPDASAR